MAQAYDMSGKTVVITGGNSGIGYEAAIALAAMGGRVVITARNQQKGADALARIRTRSGSDAVELRLLDLGSFESIRTFASEWLAAEDRLDVLLNNAGAILTDRVTTREGFEMTFGANHLGHFLLTDLLLDQLKASAPSRVINVASLAHRGGHPNFADLNWEGRRYRGPQAYNDSKLCNVLYTVELARRLAGTGVTVNCCHPGPVRTGFGSADDTNGFQRVAMMIATPFMIGPRSGSVPLVRLAADPALVDVTGKYFSRLPMSVLPVAPKAHRPSHVNDTRCRRLWEESERMIATVADAGS
jgi:NAD(P)-dependent dehydrogenase (short-subunit alcohol dehydrogenase family)